MGIGIIISFYANSAQLSYNSYTKLLFKMYIWLNVFYLLFVYVIPDFVMPFRA